MPGMRDFDDPALRLAGAGRARLLVPRLVAGTHMGLVTACAYLSLSVSTDIRGIGAQVLLQRRVVRARNRDGIERGRQQRHVVGVGAA